MPRHSETPKAVLGTMTFGLESTNAEKSAVRVRGIENVKPFLDTLKAYGYDEVDTARAYGNGDTELALGQLPLDSFKISTKIWPGTANAFGPENIRAKVKESLAALKATKVDILYLHAVDETTPFEVTIKVMDELYREGVFNRFGLSNFPAWQVATIYQLCKQNGYVLPTAYQGVYNAITRNIQTEVLPCLKALNISFYAYNPVAGGLLSGKHKFTEDNEESRFDTKTAFGNLYRSMYWNSTNFQAVNIIDKATKEHNLTMIETSFRWLAHHSGLGPNDGLVIGASSIEHLKENLQYLERGPLPQPVIDALDKAWELVKGTAPPYILTGSIGVSSVL